MKSLQQAINDVIEKQWPQHICAELLDEKFRAQGIKLPKRKLKQLARRILEEKADSIAFEGANGEPASIQIQFTKDDGRKAKEKMERLSASLPDFVNEMVRGTEIMLATPTSSKPSSGSMLRSAQNPFATSLRK